MQSIAFKRPNHVLPPFSPKNKRDDPGSTKLKKHFLNDDVNLSVGSNHDLLLYLTSNTTFHTTATRHTTETFSNLKEQRQSIASRLFEKSKPVN